jgi:hypothetical protein
MAGGSAAILSPLAPMGVPVEILQNGPFTDFLIPGLFLFLFLGVFNVICGFVSLKNKKLTHFISFFMGVVLCLWIVIQCLILMDVGALHIIFFLIRALQNF